MKVAHVVRQYIPSRGGLESAVGALAQAQVASLGHHVRIVTLDRLFTSRHQRLPAFDRIGGIDIVRIPFAGSSRYPLAPTCLRYVLDVDIVHVHGIDFFFDYLALTKPIHRRPLVASTHGSFFHTDFARRFKEFYFASITRASSAAYAAILGSSENDAERFARIAPTRTHVLENAVNCQIFDSSTVRDLHPCLIFFGRFAHHKRIDLSIKLLTALHALSTDWRLIIAGREYELSSTGIQAMADREGIAFAVRVVPDPNEHALSALVSQASYFTCLSTFEGFGVAAVEACAAGLIPILSDIPPFRDLVQKAGAGFLVEPSALETWARRIQDFHVTNRTSAAAMTSKLQDFTRKFRPDVVASNIDCIYQQATKCLVAGTTSSLF